MRRMDDVTQKILHFQNDNEDTLTASSRTITQCRIRWTTDKENRLRVRTKEAKRERERERMFDTMTQHKKNMFFSFFTSRKDKKNNKTKQQKQHQNKITI